MGRLNGYIGYTFGYTWRKWPTFNVAIGDESQTARFYPPKYDRRNDVKIILNYELSRKWKFTGAWVYATGQAYTEATGRYAVYDTPWSAINQNNLLVVENVNASRLPNYHRADVSFSRSGTFFGLGEAELQLQVINIYSR